MDRKKQLEEEYHANEAKQMQGGQPPMPMQQNYASGADDYPS